MKTYVGIDPGKTGCVAVIVPAATAVTVPIPQSLFDTVNALAYMNGTVSLFDAENLDLYELAKKINLPDGVFVLLEKAQVMGKGEGAVGMFKYGVGYGEYLGMLKSWRIPYAEIHPMTWKKEYSLVGIPPKEVKERSISVAKSVFPLLADQLTRKKDHHRAESLLIAEYARRKNY